MQPHSGDGRPLRHGEPRQNRQTWDAVTGLPIGKAMRHDDAVLSASFSPNNAQIVTASFDGTARIWEAASGSPIGEPLRHPGQVALASFSPDGARIVTASDRAVRLWDAASGRSIGAAMAHEALVSVRLLQPDGARAMTTGAHDARNLCEARLWDGRTGSASASLLLTPASI